MLRDARGLEDGAVLDADVCIVGTGAAGVTLAAELAGSGRRVLVVEAGGVGPDPQTEALNEFESSDLPVPTTSRQRFLGGATNTWWGKVALLDGSDLAARDWLPGSGWPIGLEDLLPHYRRACELLGIPDLTAFEAADARGGGRPRLGAGGPLEDKPFFWTRHALNFGVYLRRRLSGAANISTLLHANVTEVVQDEHGRVDRLAVATVNGRKLSIRPTIAVLACGGIENARLLLASRSRAPEGVGNGAGAVGRYYMDHPRGPSGFVEATPALSALSPAYWSGKRHGSARFRLGVGLAPDVRDERHVLNSYVNLSPIYGGAAVEAIRNLYRHRAKALRDGSIVRAMLTGIPDVARYFAFKRYGRGSVRLLSIGNFTEQEPLASNRVMLSERLDAFGNPLARVTWTLSERDRRSVRVLHEALDAELRRRGMGRVRAPILHEDDEPWTVTNDAAHHMGTTRMGNDPKSSVVDAACRVHGVDNLYIAGSSVFPTGGSVNPTLTIMALATRLADRMRSSLEGAIAVRTAGASVGASQEKTA